MEEILTALIEKLDRLIRSEESEAEDRIQEYDDQSGADACFAKGTAYRNVIEIINHNFGSPIAVCKGNLK